MSRKQIKSGCEAAFFLFALACAALFLFSGQVAASTPQVDPPWSVPELQALALDKRLDHADKWLALLHVSHQKPQIQDRHFILTLDNFSARHELLATIAYLYGPQSQQAVCRFPARYAWLRSELPLPELPLNRCDELNEFVTHAPTDSIALVFASENLSQPSSMMGHLFLKVSGLSREGQRVDHAISFFTDAGTLNIPKLFFDSMVVGKKGFFVLSPYQDEVSKYVTQEQRTLWEYELRLPPADIKLLQYHMQELKHTEITYFFQDYNCATLVKQIVAIGAPAILSQSGWWVTPKEVIQRTHESKLIGATTVKTPSRWLVRTLQTTMPTAQVETIRQYVKARGSQPLDVLVDGSSQQNFLTLELARAYNTYLYEQRIIEVQDWRLFDQRVKAVEKERYPGLELQMGESKNPVLAPREKQFSTGWKVQANTDYILLGLLPVSHTLADDNSQHANESELRLFDLAVLANTQTGSIKLDHLTIYATQTLLSRDALTGGLSGRFKIGFEQQPNPRREGQTALLIEGALGITLRPASDVDLFAMLGGGVGYHHQAYVYGIPQVGMVIREIYQMKSILAASRVTRPLGDPGHATEVSLTQSKYLDAKNTLMLEVRRTRYVSQSSTQLGLMFKHIF